MSRRANEDWNLPESITWDHVSIAVLMDIREELRRLNRLLHCSNFLAIPSKLDALKPRKERNGVHYKPLEFPGAQRQRKARPVIQQ